MSVEHPGPVLAWMQAVLRRGAIPHLDTFVTPALRLAQAVEVIGMDRVNALRHAPGLFPLEDEYVGVAIAAVATGPVR